MGAPSRLWREPAADVPFVRVGLGEARSPGVLQEWVFDLGLPCSPERQEPWGWPDGEPYLAFPKGSAGSFDGLNVPYNHQNEWAYAMTRAGAPSRRRADAQAIESNYLRRIAPDGRLPLSGTCDYWWGQAYDGWTEAEGVSANTPAYEGDHIKAVKSFRSIDAMGALAVAPTLDRTTRSHLESSAAALIVEDDLYPFVA